MHEKLRSTSERGMSNHSRTLSEWNQIVENLIPRFPNKTIICRKLLSPRLTMEYIATGDSYKSVSAVLEVYQTSDAIKIHMSRYFTFGSSQHVVSKDRCHAYRPRDAHPTREARFTSSSSVRLILFFLCARCQALPIEYECVASMTVGANLGSSHTTRAQLITEFV